MSTVTDNDGREFRMECDPIEVTSNHRPDERWQHTDLAGHTHQWEWPSGKRLYSPTQQATLPTLHWVKTGVRYDEDGEEYEVGEYRCLQCQAVVEPRFTADRCRQYIPGLRRCYINDQPVSHEEFERAVKEAIDGGQ